MSSRPHLPPAAVDYPSSDGKPLAENDLQARAILYAFGALRVRYSGRRSDVYVSADLLIYYEEGNPRVSVAPDVFVVFGVEDHARMNYKVWEEGKGPDFVLEVASPNTWREDVERKPGIYAGLGVREYFLFDPMGEHYTPRLQGYRLVGGWVRAVTDGGVHRPCADDAQRGAGPSICGRRARRCASTTRRRARHCSVTRKSTLHGGRKRLHAGRKPPHGAPPRRGSRSWRRACGRWKARRGRADAPPYPSAARRVPTPRSLRWPCGKYSLKILISIADFQGKVRTPIPKTLEESIPPDPGASLRRDRPHRPPQKMRFTIGIRITRKRTVMRPPARMKSTTR